MNLTNIQLGSNTAPGSPFTVNRYIDANSFKLVINGTGTNIFELTTGVSGATRRFAFASSGQYTMDAYGSGTFTGTETKWLAVTAAGLVIEKDPPSGSTITADNGLTMSTATNVQLGGTLIQNTTINATASFKLTVTGSIGTQLFNVTNTGSGTSIFGNSSGSGDGVYGQSSTGAGVRAISSGAGSGLIAQSGTGFILEGFTSGSTGAVLQVNPASTNTIVPVLQLSRSSSGTAADGIGGSIEFYNETSGSGAGQPISNSILSKFTTDDNATRTSQLDITGVNSAATGTIASFYGSGVVGIGISSSYTATRLNVVDNAVGAASIVGITSTSTAAASNLQKGINISLSGANATASQSTYGIYVDNSHTGTSPVNFGVYATTSGSGRSLSGLNTGAGRAVDAQNSSTGIGVFSSATSGAALDAQNTSTTYVARFLTTTSATTSQQLISSFQHQTSGTAAVGFGSYINFTNETDGNSGRETALYGGKWSNATDATRQGTAFISAYNGSTALEKMNLYAHYTTLTEASATAFLRINIPSSEVIGGEIIVTIEANDATDYQARTLRFIWSAVNKAGTLTANVATAEESVAVSAGTLTVSIDTNDAGGGNLDFRANATSSLAQTTLRCNAVLVKNFGTGTITPQN